MLKAILPLSSLCAITITLSLGLPSLAQFSTVVGNSTPGINRSLTIPQPGRFDGNGNYIQTQPYIVSTLIPVYPAQSLLIMAVSIVTIAKRVALTTVTILITMAVATITATITITMVMVTIAAAKVISTDINLDYPLLRHLYIS